MEDSAPADIPPPPPSSSFAAGRLLGGKYRLIRRLGEGAMGEVWAAVNVALDLPVALKLIHRRARHPELLRRLLREGQAAAKLAHPGVVRVYDFGETDADDPYIVMERLEGEDLRQVLEARGRLSAEEAVRVMLPVAAALHAAHLRGVVHRDLKPDNVFLSRDHAGRVHPKILDFGIAKLVWIEAEQQAAEEQVVGTPEYMAPEQAFEPEDADHRVDVWGFSSVLYELIAGHQPLPSRGMLDAMRAALQDKVPSLCAAGLADEELWSVIDRGLHKDPGQRWRSMQDCGEALAEWAAAHGIVEDITGAALNSDWAVPVDRQSALPGALATPFAQTRRTLPGGLAPPARDAEEDDDATARDDAVGTTTSEPPAYQPTASDRDSDAPLSQMPLSAPGKPARMIGAVVVGVGAVGLLIAWLSLPKANDPPPSATAPLETGRVSAVPAVTATATATAVPEPATPTPPEPTLVPTASAAATSSPKPPPPAAKQSAPAAPAQKPAAKRSPRPAAPPTPTSTPEETPPAQSGDPEPWIAPPTGSDAPAAPPSATAAPVEPTPGATEAPPAPTPVPIPEAPSAAPPAPAPAPTPESAPGVGEVAPH
jgi:serine/threonine-protein kinase